MRKARWVLPVVSVLILVVSVLVAIWLQASDVIRIAVLQAGAGLSLAVLTLGYLLASNEQATAAAVSAVESQNMRIDSVRPVLCLRYMWHNLEEGCPGFRTERSTRLVNLGCGPALGIRLRWNLEPEKGYPDLRSNSSPQLVDCSLNSIAFGSMLGVDTGNPDMQIAFLKAGQATSFYTPLEDPHAVIEVSYRDIFGNGYVTQLRNCVQAVSHTHSGSMPFMEMRAAKASWRTDMDGSTPVPEKSDARTEPEGRSGQQIVQPSLVDLVNVVSDRIDPLLRLVETWLGHSKEREKATEAHQRNMTIIVAVLVLVIVVSAGLLTYLDKVDGSTFTFLLGLVVGYILTFIREAVFPKSNTK